MNKKDGGPAFPSSGYYGMSLRDYLAAKAMQAQLCYGDCRDMSLDGVAKSAYEYADAMLTEREK